MTWSRWRRGTGRRLEIVSAGVGIAITKGLGAVSYPEVARGAQSSNGAVQCHFPSSDALRAAVVKACSEELFERIPGHLYLGKSGPPGLATAWTIAEETLVGWRAVRVVVEALIGTETSPGGETRSRAVETAERWREILRIALTRAERDGELSKQADPAMLLLAIQAITWADPWGPATLGPRVFADCAARSVWSLLAGSSSKAPPPLPALDERLAALREALGFDALQPPAHPPGSPEWETSEFDVFGRRLYAWDLELELDDPARLRMEEAFHVPAGSTAPLAAARRARALERAQRR